jgi:hypothetical protein
VTIRVALVSASGIRGDLLERVIERDPRFHLISYSADLTAVAGTLVSLPNDAVIVWSLSGEVPREAERRLTAGRLRALISVTPDGRDVRLRVPGRAQQSLKNPSPSSLLDAIRNAVR